MRIQFRNIYPTKHIYQSKCSSNYDLRHDTVSFGAMKKSQFEGLDLYAVERFKPPIEKFNSNEDLQNWAKLKYDEILKQPVLGRCLYIRERRKEIIDEWSDYITNENDAYTNVQRLIILSGIVQKLGHNDETTPPDLNKGVLAQTIDELNKKLKINPKHQFNFSKVYNYNLVNQTESNSIDNKDNHTGWIIIPSKIHDEENFAANVDKLKALSHHNWCTKSLNAEPYLTDGDFHIFLKEGKPKVGIRFVGDKVKEIQGEKNNSKIPIGYYDEIIEHLSSNHIEVNEETKQKLDKAKESIEKYNSYKEKFAILLKNNDTEGIFTLMGIKYKKDNDGLYTISHYKASFDDNEYTISDFGVKENELFDKIKEIKGKANFKASQVTKFKTLKKIGGRADFDGSQIVNLGSIEEIGGAAYFAYSPVRNLGNLRKIGGDFTDYKSKLESLFKLEEIGGHVDLQEIEPRLKDLGALKKVGGTMMIGIHSILKSLGQLEEVGGYLVLESPKINSLGNLKRVGGELRLFNKIRSAGKIEEIGEEVTGINLPLDDKKTYNNLKKLVRASNAIKRLGLKDYQRNGIWQDLRYFMTHDGYYSGWDNFFKRNLKFLTIKDIDSINIPEKIEELREKDISEYLKKEIPNIIKEYNEARAKY